MKLLKIIYYRIRCVITMDHSKFTLYSYSLELKAAGKKYYYFKDIKNGKYVKVLKEENGVPPTFRKFCTLSSNYI